jgi:hypothetical protein
MLEDRGLDQYDDLTWERLVAAEPRLASLLEEVRAARPADADEFELEGIWGQFKDRIADLVGWHRRQGEPLLRTQAAYRTAYHTLLGALHGERATTLEANGVTLAQWFDI